MNETPNQTQQENIFIINSKPSSTKGFENYLKNRGWAITSTSELKKALISILSQPFKVAMISVDHPNPKCLRLPPIIAQTVRIPVILFSEGSTQNGMLALRNSKHPYILFPPVSGPAVERMLLKIEKDRLALLEQLQQNGAASGDRIEMSGSGLGSDGRIELKSSGSFSMADVVRLFEGDGTLPNRMDEGSSLTGKTDFLDHGTLAPIKSSTLGSSESPASLRGSESGPESNSMNMTLNSSNQDLGDASSAIATRPLHGHMKGEEPGSELKAVQTHPSGRILTAEESMLVKGTEHALSKTVVQNSKEHAAVHRVSNCSRVSCFEIRSDFFKGYLIVAFGSDRDVDEEFNSSLRKNLLNYLAENGLVVPEKDVLDLKLSEVSFEQWSIREATFLRKAVHHENEIALAFFPYVEKDAPLELSAEHHMYKMNLEELRADVSLEFDVYLYFPTNRKYIRYAAKTRQIAPSQRSRLESGGVQEVHVRKESESDVIRYRVQNFLNDKIKALSAA